MRVLQFTNELDLGGTSKTMLIFCKHLKNMGVSIKVACRKEGPRKSQLEDIGVPVVVVGDSLKGFADLVNESNVLHIHTSGLNDEPLANTILSVNKRPIIVETNVFGAIDLKGSHTYTDLHLFVSKTLWLKAARQNPIIINDPRYSFLYNPIETQELRSLRQSEESVKQYRDSLDITNKFVMGRLGRPVIGKWDPFLEDVAQILDNLNFNGIFLIKSAPKSVETRLKNSNLHNYFRFLATSSDEREIVQYYQSLDVLTHTSSIGETFGCTIAEAMSLNLPVVVNSTPIAKNKLYRDNAQVELVDNGVTGYVTNNPTDYARAIMHLQRKKKERVKMGNSAYEKSIELYGAQHISGLLYKMYEYLLTPQGKISPIPKVEFDVYDSEYELRKSNLYGKKIGILHQKLLDIKYKAIRGIDSYYESRYNHK